MSLYIWREAEYEAFREKLEIRRDALDDDVIEMPMVVIAVSEIVVLSAARADRLINEWRVARATVLGEIKQDGEKRTVAAMEAEVDKDADVIAAQKVAEKAKTSHNHWSKLLDAFRVKQSSLKRLGEYMMAGYMATSSVVSVRRQQAEQREEYRKGRPRLKGVADDD